MAPLLDLLVIVCGCWVCVEFGSSFPDAFS
jgi:hypothetical protein